MNELQSALISSIVEPFSIPEARQEITELGFTPLSPLSAEAVTLLTRTTQVSAAAVISHSGAVATLAVAAGMTEGVVTFINAQPEIVDHTRQSFKREKPEKVVLRPITGLPLDVVKRLADGGYDLLLVEDAGDNISLYVEAAARLLRSGGLLVLPNSLADGHFTEMLDPATVTTPEEEAALTAATLAGMLTESEDFEVYRLPLDAGMTVAVRL